MNIVEIAQYSDAVLAALNRLLPQLSSDVSPLSKRDLQRIIDSDMTYLLMALDGQRYVGCLTLVVFTTPSRKKALVEDVVVHEGERGQGTGRLLLEHAVHLAGALQAETIDLTSRPARRQANNLYRKLGFSRRETNVYRYLCR